MKKIYALLIMIMIFMTACQPTPEKEAVVGKSDDNLDSIIRSTSAPAMNIENMQPKETWQEQLDGKNITVNIDAGIEFPKVVQLPVVKAEYLYLTEDDAWKAIQVFFQDATVYNEPIFTKEALEAQIVELKKVLANIQSGAIDEDEDSTNNQIEYYQGLLQTAPSEDEASQALNALSFQKQTEREAIKVSANIGNNGSPATLMIERDENTYSLDYILFKASR